MGDAPVVEINGSRRDLPGSSLPLLDDEMDVANTEIVVTGKHGFYRVGIRPEDVESYWLFPTHEQVNLDPLFLRRDLVTTLHDANQRRLASFKFHYQSEMGIASQCGGSELQNRFPEEPAACVSLLRRIMADISGHPEARLLRDFGGSVSYRRRLYRYGYSFGPELVLSITAPEAESEFANMPQTAPARFLSAGMDERQRLVSEFAKDVGSLSSRALEQVFQTQYASSKLLDFLSGTTAQRIDALHFARDVLALGVDHVTVSEVDHLVVRILDRNVSPSSNDRVFVPALDALVALSRGSSGLRSRILGELGAFVTVHGTNHNAAKPTIAGILLQALGGASGQTESDRVVAILSTIRRNAVGAGHTISLIGAQIRERLRQIRNPRVVEGLCAVIDTDNGIGSESAEGDAQ